MSRSTRYVGSVPLQQGAGSGRRAGQSLARPDGSTPGRHCWRAAAGEQAGRHEHAAAALRSAGPAATHLSAPPQPTTGSAATVLARALARAAAAACSPSCASRRPRLLALQLGAGGSASRSRASGSKRLSTCAREPCAMVAYCVQAQRPLCCCAPPAPFMIHTTGTRAGSPNCWLAQSGTPKEGRCSPQTITGGARELGERLPKFCRTIPERYGGRRRSLRNPARCERNRFTHASWVLWSTRFLRRRRSSRPTTRGPT